MSGYIVNRKPLGMSIDEDFSQIFLFNTYPTLASFSFKFFIYDSVNDTTNQFTNISIDLVDLAVTVSFNNLDLIAKNIAISKNHRYWLHQTDPTGFESNVYTDSFQVNPTGEGFNPTTIGTTQNIIAQIYQLRSFFGSFASEEYVTNNPLIDWSNGQTQTLQLAAGTNNLTFINPLSGLKSTIRLKQPDSGYGTITLPVNIHWLNNNSILVPSIGSSKYDLLTLIYYPSDNIYIASYANY